MEKADPLDEKHIEASPTLSSSENEIEQGGLRTVEKGFKASAVLDTLELDAAERKRILRKVDFRLVPLLAFLYL